jgi:hypothetical protein
MTTNSKSTCKTDTGKCNTVNTAVKNQKPNSLNLENMTNIPRTKISKTTTMALNNVGLGVTCLSTLFLILVFATRGTTLLP